MVWALESPIGPHNPSAGLIIDGSSFEQAVKAMMAVRIQAVTMDVFFLIDGMGLNRAKGYPPQPGGKGSETAKGGLSKSEKAVSNSGIPP